MDRPKLTYYPIVSFLIPTIILIIDFIDYILNHTISAAVNLSPQLIIISGEVHRILLYFTINGSIADTLLMIFAFSVCSSLFETTFQTMIYPLLLFILAVFYGLLYTLIFLNYNIVYQGIEPLSFYLITLFTATKFRQYVDLPSINYRLRVAFVSFAMLAVWVILTVMPAIRFGITAIYPELLSLIFGVSTGLLSFGFMKFLYKRNTFKKNKSSAEAQGIQMPDKEELTPAIISASHIEQMIEKDKELFYSKQNAISSEPEENEQRLNKILEKINAEGRESLTDDEQAFLFYYSQQL